MSGSVISSGMFGLQNAKTALDISVKSWFAIALVGQWAFALYVFFIYALTLAFGVDITDISPASGVRETEGFDRVVFFSHIVPSVYLSLFGLFQLVPAIRNRFRGFHRWNGRLFLVLGLCGALTGLYLQWIKGLNFSQGVTVNGLLILLAVAATWYYAVNRRFDLHMRWAVHTFILVNGVWSFRLYLMGWYLVNQGPNGNTPNVNGPMDVFLSFACYLIPMAIAELYFWVKRQRHNHKVWAATTVMTIGALITLIGVFAAITMMWTPRIAKVLTVI
ncbi:DUF2306 domain-containing protein [Aestuariibacter halophilus]|uniref:DUF2306 domain-containing protein n=1 Tax=Fluctibacter halophilus TaxID=226011 RepID=A0ABS8GAW0_9ALTE|nr:DUF2306 domain-containing protein [Aestuariibacter halophilus]MCC2617722.1 DUF2306 domain-containing protein [Aestuariibacter halophilus]